MEGGREGGKKGNRDREGQFKQCAEEGSWHYTQVMCIIHCMQPHTVLVY